MLLRELDHGHWADWMGESAARLRHDDASGVSYLRSAYGGMGSFSDILAELVGGKPDDRVARARRLRAVAWGPADELR